MCIIRGKKCCVLEQGEQIGGGAHVFSLKGFEFETGIHYLGNDIDMENMLDFATCGKLKMERIGTTRKNGDIVHDEVFIGDNKYDFMSGVDKFRGMMMQKFPNKDDIKVIDCFFTRVQTLMTPTYKQHAAWFFRLKAATFIPAWLRAFLQRILGRQFWQMTQVTAEQFVKDCGADPTTELGSVLLGQYADAGVRPDKLAAALYAGVFTHYINGAKYPEGGSGALPRRMNTVVRATGGCTFVQARVNSLLMNKQNKCEGVMVNNSIPVYADTIVSGIGAIQSFKLLSPHYPKECSAAIARLERNHEYSCAFIFLFIALDISSQPEEEIDDSSHNRWIYPQKDFVNMEKKYDDAEAWSVPMPMFVASGSSKDSTWGKRFGKNKKTIVVLSQCPWNWVKEWSTLSVSERANSPGYQAFKQKTTDALMEQGFRRIYSHLEKYVVFNEVGTPLTTNNFLATSQGECYGIAATPSHFMDEDLTPYTPCSNYYMTHNYEDCSPIVDAGSISAGYLTANVVEGYGEFINALAGRELSTDLGMKPVYG